MSGGDTLRWLKDQGDDEELLANVAYAFPPDADCRVGVAVSGGGDSVALLHLMARACRHHGVPVSAVTVDHRLRAGSAEEAAGVGRVCSTLAVPHTVVVWEHGPVERNLMDTARRARMALITAWARSEGVTHIALGHTADDQAETFLMALSRASGLDGLVGMRRTWRADGIVWSRPLLDTRRADLRAYLQRHHLSWAEDPTNDDPRFERARARRAMAQLAPLGIDADKIGLTLFHLRFAKQALDEVLRKAVSVHVPEVAGALRVDRSGFEGLPHDIQRQVMNATVAWLSGNPLPPRTDKQLNLLYAARDKRDATLHGCRMRHKPDHLLITREPRAVAALSTPTDTPWDNRWHLSGPHAPDLTIRALGADGLRACKDWRATGLPREVLIVTPAVWRGDTLVAAPLAGWSEGWTATVSPSFAATILAH